MRLVGSIVTIALLWAVAAPAQERKIEISPFAGGYFSAGFQSFEAITLQFTPASGTVASREFKPLDEPNSGIFGVRASYDLTSRFSMEGNVGFSPAGLRSESLPSDCLNVDVNAGLGTGLGTPDLYFDPCAFSIFLPSIRGKDTFHYNGNVVFHWRKANGWAPFLTAGLGAVQRTADIVLSPSQRASSVSGGRRASPAPGGTTVIVIPLPGTSPSGTTQPTPPVLPLLPVSLPIPSPSRTDFSIIFGGGVKKYFSDRWGIRVDFRDYVSTLSGDTVNNMEVSLGLIFKM